MRFANETVADVQGEHLSKLTVNGSPAVDAGAGQNVTLVGDGGSGTILTRYVPPTDSDMDGMLDNWESSYFGNLSRDGTGDFDNDGLSDLTEFTLGTFPNNPDSDNDLQGWITLGTTEIGSEMMSAEECLERVTFATDDTTADEPMLFSRVMVEAP